MNTDQMTTSRFGWWAGTRALIALACGILLTGIVIAGIAAQPEYQYMPLGHQVRNGTITWTTLGLVLLCLAFSFFCSRMQRRSPAPTPVSLALPHANTN